MRAVLIDDESLALDYLEQQLRKVCDLDSIKKFTDPMSSFEAILREDADVVFLDIQMPEIDGIEFAERLLERKPGLQVVFVTAYHEFAVQAFELNAVDYVLKPVGTERLRNTLTRLRLQDARVNGPKPAEPRAIRMHLFREVLVESAENRLVPVRWRTAKAQELFLYLLQHRDRHARKDTLIEILWPEHEAGKAYSLLYTTIYHIRKTLEPYGSHFTISNLSEGYTLRLEHVKLDVEEWEAGLRIGTTIPADELAPYEKLAGLYRGDYLQDYDYWWAESERERLKLLWVRSTLHLAEAYLAAGQRESAISKYMEICERSPSMEEAHFALMKLFAEVNHHVAVQRQYDLLASVMREEINAPPSSYIREWYEEWNHKQKE